MHGRLRTAPQFGLTACLILAIATLLAEPAWSQTRNATPRLSPKEASRATQAMVTWFECEECEDGELNAVTRYGEAVLPSLIAVLNDGPSPASRELLRRELGTRFDELLEQSKKNANAKISLGKDEFVAMYLSNYEAQHRVRAAQALAAIGGTTARKALAAASQKAYRDDVRATIRESLSKIK